MTWFKDITKINTLALEMSSGFKIIKESSDFIEFKIDSPKVDKVRVNRKNSRYEVLGFSRGHLCGYKGKIVESSLIPTIERMTSSILS